MTTPQLLVTTSTAPASADPAREHYSLLVARDSPEVLAAQRLRHRVFAGELGARLRGPAAGVDSDEFDDYCDHLVVRHDNSGEIVGTYRMLPPSRARALGRLYSDDEFDLERLAGLRSSLVETGRSCVHPDHRGGAVIGLVWAGLARYMFLSGHRYLAGCASVSLADGGAQAAGVWDLVLAKHLSPAASRVRPLHPWDVDAAPRPSRAQLPSLLRGYIRLGARVCGKPAHDPEFDVADFFVLLALADIDQRRLRFFLGDMP